MSLKFFVLFTITLAAACEGRRLEKDHIDLDPEVEAQVKAINLERYGGHWFMQGSEGSIYLELSDKGFYGQADDLNGQPLAMDYGAVQHYKPGLMIVHSARVECQDKSIVFLKMDEKGGVVRMRNIKDRNDIIPLQPVEPRMRVRSSGLSCLE